MFNSSFLSYVKSKFRVVVVDTEFQFDKSMNYIRTPICLVMKDLSTGQIFKIWDKDGNYNERIFSKKVTR